MKCTCCGEEAEKTYHKRRIVMDEYISREEVVKEIKSRIFAADDAWESGYNTAMAEIMEWIKHIPAADVSLRSMGKEDKDGKLGNR